MQISWRRSRPLQAGLSAHHPAAGLLAGNADLLAEGVFCFSPEIDRLPPPRAVAPAVLAALEERHRALDAPPEVFENLRLLREGAQAVVTGQQAGLLGGPLFTLVKTLTAVRIARDLTRRHGRPFVPVFWSETEDHDADEVNQAWTVGNAGPVRHALPWPEAHRGAPVGSLPLGEDARRLVEEFFAAGPATEFTPALAAGLLADLAGSPDWGTWFARQLQRLYGRHGLVVADPLEPQLAAATRPLWARVLEDPLALTASCQEQGRWLTDHGWRPILLKMEKRAPFFLLEGGKRLPVTYERGLFRTPLQDHTALALQRRIVERPGDFSAAVHLRPHLQDFLLPTAVYVAGPTELAYFLQLLPGYRLLEIPAPAIALRASVTLVEPVVEKTLERFGIEPWDLAEGTDQVLNATLRREQRFAAPALWEKTREQTLKPIARLAEGLREEHADLAQRAEQARGKVEFLLKELETRTLAELRKKSDTARDQLTRARDRLYPRGEPQERVLSAHVFLAKYGPGLVEALLEGLPSDYTRHHFGTLVP
jgi:bacillithiol biosynthesis cysteine-adding enzyme BshC